MNIKSVKDWPKHSNGAWVLNMTREFLKGQGVEFFDEILDTPSSLLGDKNAVEYVQWAVENGNAESYADAWHDVLSVQKRIYE